MNLAKPQKEIFFALQKRATTWLNETFSRYVCNSQDFTVGTNKVFENFLCITKDNNHIILVIEYRIKDSLEESDYYTYKDHTNF